MNNKRERLEIDGEVLESNHSIFKVKINNNGSTVSCTLGGKIRKNSVKILVGDKVKVEVSEYDMTKGRIVYRYK